MGRLLRVHWIWFCVLAFIVSRIIMLYEYEVANSILLHYKHTFFDTMCKWDCKWYITIIKDGYDLHPRTTPKVWSGLANWAFFPLYPYVVKFATIITHGNDLVVGILLNQFFMFLSLCVFYLYLKITFNELNSRFGVMLLAFSPFSVYFASLYTEALFLLLSLCAFYFMRINRPYVSAIFGGLLSATRPVGVMFSLPYLYYGLRSRGIKFSVLVGFGIAVSGLLCYMLYLYLHTGDALAFQHIQEKWGRKGFIPGKIGVQLWKMVTDYHNSVLFFASVAISIYLIKNKYVEEGLFNLFCILPGVLTGQMMSEGRFCGTLFTFYLGFVLLSKKSESLKLTFAVLFLTFYISYFLYWMAHSRFLI